MAGNGAPARPPPPMGRASLEAHYEGLPPHVQAVLGPKKNLWLLQASGPECGSARGGRPRLRTGLPQEMLAAARVSDADLARQIEKGFPLVGELPVSGGMERVATKDFRDPAALRREAPRLNADAVRRVAGDRSHDGELRREFLRKASEEARGEGILTRSPRACSPERAHRSRRAKAPGARWTRLAGTRC